MKEKLIKNRDLLFLCLFDFVLIYTIYQVFLSKIISADNFDTYLNPPSQDTGIYGLAAGGRINAAIIQYVCQIMKFNMYTMYKMSQLFKMGCSALSTILLVHAVADNVALDSIRKKTVTNFALLLGVINVFFVEVYVFYTLEWGVAIILATLAVIYFNKGNYWLSFLLAFLTVTTYQAYIMIIVILGICIVLLKNRLHICKATVLGLMYLFLITGVSCIVDLAIMKWVVLSGKHAEVKATSIDTQGINYINKVHDVFLVYFKSAFLNGYSMMPHYILPTCICLLMAIMIYQMVKQKYLWYEVLFCLILHIVMYMSSFMLGFVQAGIFLPCRVVFPFFYALSCSFILVMSLIESTRIRWLVEMALVVLFCSSLVNTQKVNTDRYVTFTLDVQYADEVEANIEQYEQNYHIQVDTLVILPWEYRHNYMYEVYKDYMHYSYDPETFMMKTGWSDWGVAPLMQYVSGKHYKLEYMSFDKYKEMFGEQINDKIILSKQLIYEGNKVYWAMY